MSEDIIVTFEQDPIVIEVTPEGKDGQSLIPCGNWDITRVYDYMSIVYYDGASYLALQNVPAGTALTNADYWTAFAAQNSDPSSRASTWGLIQGNIENQLDLQTELGLKADASDVYTKTETDGLLADKADSADVYTKTESDSLLSAKANSADVYTKTETDNLLADKADSDNVYTKTETDTLLGVKANSADVYTKTEANTLLNAKANSVDVYTKTATDNLLSAKANTADLGTMSAENASNYYTKTATDSLLSAKANTADLGDLATQDSIDYTSNQITNKPTLGSLADQDMVNYETEVTNKPTLGALADHNTVDYSTEVTNKPTLGTMASQDDASADSKQYVRKNNAWEDLSDTLAKKADLVTKSTSGSIVQVTDASAYPASALTIGIEPVQDLHGYDNPWPAGGGKNLYDMDNDYYGQGKYWSSSDGTLTDNASYYGSPKISVQPSTQYTRSTGANSNIFYDANGDFLSTSTGFTFTTPATAYYVTFNVVNSVNHSIVQLEKGSTSTSWTPYSNVCPITGHTQAVVTRTGRNLWSLNSSYVCSEGAYFINQTPLVLPSGTYTLNYTASSTSGQIALRFMDANADTITTVSTTNSTHSATFTITTDCAYVLGYSNSAVTLSDIQIELGSSASDFEAYSGTSVTIDLGGTRYGGTLDVVTGVMTIDRISVTLDGSENWYEGTATEYGISRFVVCSKLNVPERKSNLASDVISNYFTKVADNTTSYISGTGFIGGGSAGYLIFMVDYTFAQNAQAWKTWLSTHNVQYCYEIATPLTVALDPHTLQLLAGDNVVWADTGDVTNLTYLTQVADGVGQLIDSRINATVQEQQTLIGSVEVGTASRNFSTNEFLVMNNVLYKVTSPIANGGTITVGTNVVATTIAEQLTALLNA